MWALGHKDHHEKAKGPVAVYVVTVSDTRTEETDTSGALIREQLKLGGHSVTGHVIIPDEPDRIRGVLGSLPGGTQAVIINGGTGISKRDRTYDAIVKLLDKEIPGFGELFRALSYNEIGASAIMSRATAGVMGDTVVVSTPGSRGAVSLAMKEIILPELAHMVWESGR